MLKNTDEGFPHVDRDGKRGVGVIHNERVTRLKTSLYFAEIAVHPRFRTSDLPCHNATSLSIL